MIPEEERVDQLFWEFAKANEALLVQSLDRTRTFAEGVDDYRRLEADFVARMADSALGALEIKRRIAEDILRLTHHKHPPFEVCREAWNDLVRLGFTNIELECRMTWFYTDCCAYDEKQEEGLAVIEPLLSELERQLEEARATQSFTGFYEHELENLGDLRDELLAQRRGQLSPDRITRRIAEADRSTPEEERVSELRLKFSNACHAVYKTFARSRDRSFAEVAADYRRVEADIVARAGSEEAFKRFVLNVRKRIAQEILSAACSLEQPFEICREAWNDLVGVGFTSFGEQCRLTDFYAETCGWNHKPEEGLVVLEPLLAELERGLEAELERRSEARAKLEPPSDDLPPRYYREKLESLGELRDKLEAQRSGP